jgi:hypothetical protein
MPLSEFLAALQEANVKQVFESSEEYAEFWSGIEEGTRAQSEEFERAHRVSEQMALRSWRA